ncbi:MAG TPA: glycoside hydrolase family 3 C-terminal domain-containing protein [Candidatus Sulfotelmatobacter sp.]|nr:glycoside hydrolase family 3 C-terminal domain-containing protein [Candidatus Sulfotelmatobacter sp.]
MQTNRLPRISTAIFGLVAFLFAFAPRAAAQTTASATTNSFPWMNRSLSPDQRADLVLQQMTLDEKIQLVHGTGWGVLRDGDPVPPRSNLGAGYVPGIDRLGIPDINLADSAVGVRMAALQGRYATPLPSSLALAATWNLDAANLYGSVIGRELRDLGYNMSIGGGVDLAREPRNGRNFEYAGEDPLLAGAIVGNLAKGVQSQQVMGDIKHYAVNDQETGRFVCNVVIDKRTLRETDGLAFQIAIGIAEPAGVMCSYNKLNGDYACENDYLLNQFLKKDLAFKGWVLSDWDGTHSTVKAVNNGLDMEQPGYGYLGDPLKKAVQGGQVSQGRLDDMVHRILRSMFAIGVVDNPTMPRRVVDPFRGHDDSQQIAEQSIVLLKNSDHLLPLAANHYKSIAVIGSHADVGVLSGGGSSQVDAPGGNAINPKQGAAEWQQPVYFPSAPLKYIREKAPEAKVTYNDGNDSASAAALAKSSDLAIVFVNQYMTEDRDAATLSLPDNQDALVHAVAAANPRTIVVLETGGPVSMPWASNVKGILEAWYPGIAGAQAISNILFGDVNPSAKLPITFAKSDADLPHPQVPGMDLLPQAIAAHQELPPFDIHYTEGLKVGYKWFEAEKKEPLFPFGFGLSYTTYTYSALKLDQDQRCVMFTVKNTGTRAGAEIAEVYVELPSAAGEPFQRLVAWDRVELASGESKNISLPLRPLYLSIFNEAKNDWQLLPGDYKIHVGPSSADTPLTATLHIHD